MLSPKGRTPSSQDWGIIAEEWAKAALKQEVVDGSIFWAQQSSCKYGLTGSYDSIHHTKTCASLAKAQRIRKVKVDTKSHPYLRSCWQLIVLWDGEPVFSKGLTPVSLLCSSPRTRGQHKLHLCFVLKNMKLSGKGKRVNPIGVGVCEYDECMLSKFLKEIIFLNKLTFKAGHSGTCL